MFFINILVTIFNFYQLGPLGRVGSVVTKSVCVFVCCLSLFNVLDFEAYFPPTSQNRMSKNFRDSESFGKSAGKKRSQNWTFLSGSSLKSPHKKS